MLTLSTFLFSCGATFDWVLYQGPTFEDILWWRYQSRATFISGNVKKILCMQCHGMFNSDNSVLQYDRPRSVITFIKNIKKIKHTHAICFTTEAGRDFPRRKDCIYLTQMLTFLQYLRYNIDGHDENQISCAIQLEFIPERCRGIFPPCHFFFILKIGQ